MDIERETSRSGFEVNKMRIGLIDVDGHNFPNLTLMKISAWHKAAGDEVAWYNPLTAWQHPPDLAYMSKVFTVIRKFTCS